MSRLKHSSSKQDVILSDDRTSIIHMTISDYWFHTIFQLAISWRSALLVEGIRVSGENHRPIASHRQTVSPFTTSDSHED